LAYPAAVTLCSAIYKAFIRRIMTGEIIDLGGFDQFDLNGANVLIFQGAGADDCAFADFLENNYPDSHISNYSVESAAFSANLKQKIESSHYSFIFAFFSGNDEYLPFVDEAMDFFIELTESMGSTTVLLVAENKKQDTKSYFRNKIREYAKLISRFNDFHLNPLSLLLVPQIIENNRETAECIAQLALTLARSQEAGIYVSPQLHDTYDLPVWSRYE
jgi:hypothetical protein